MNKLCNDNLINIFHFITTNKDYDTIRLISKGWNLISMSKPCLKSFLDFNYGLDKRPNFPDHYKSLFFASKQKSLDIMVISGFHKKLKSILPNIGFLWLDKWENIFDLSLIFERRKTIVLLWSFYSMAAKRKELRYSFDDTLKNMLMQNSSIIDVIFEHDIHLLFTKKMIDTWFEYASFGNFEKFIMKVNVPFSFLQRLITIYDKLTYRDIQKKIHLLFSLVGQTLQDEQLETLAYFLYYHRTTYSSSVFDFLLQYPVDKLCKLKYFTMTLVMYKKCDYLGKHLDLLEQPDSSCFLYSIREKRIDELQLILRLKKRKIDERFAIDCLFEETSKQLHEMFRDSINIEYNSTWNPLENLLNHPIKIIKVWCTTKYVVDLIQNHKIWEIYSDYKFLKILKTFLKAIKPIVNSERDSLIVRLFYSLGLKTKQNQRTRSIIKTFGIIKNWYPYYDNFIVKLSKMLIKHMPFYYWSLEINKHQPQLQADT